MARASGVQTDKQTRTHTHGSHRRLPISTLQFGGYGLESEGTRLLVTHHLKFFHEGWEGFREAARGVHTSRRLPQAPASFLYILLRGGIFLLFHGHHTGWMEWRRKCAQGNMCGKVSLETPHTADCTTISMPQPGSHGKEGLSFVKA